MKRLLMLTSRLKRKKKKRNKYFLFSFYYMVNIPSVEKCIKLMEEYEMPEHIKAHSFKVKDVAVYLAKELNKKGESLDVKLVETSALLHDLGKIHCVNTEDRHDHFGADLLRQLGYDRIAEIVKNHVDLEKNYKKIVEDEIVNYSDKRVMHDKIVTLTERIEDIKERYNSEIEKIHVTAKKAYRLEKKIFKNLDFFPDDLVDLI